MKEEIKYTAKQINFVYDQLQADPNIVIELVDSAQSGNVDDMSFLAELQNKKNIDIFINPNRTVVFQPIPEDDVRFNPDHF